MSVFITYVLASAMIGYAVVLLIDLVVTRARRRVLIQAGGLAAVILLLHVTLDFPNPKQSFGGTMQFTALVIMLVATVFGMAAHYGFYMEPKKFAWQEFLRPFLVSPIVLLPLLGSALGGSDLTTIQLISFAFLAFQNGFFWKLVLKNATPRP